MGQAISVRDAVLNLLYRGGSLTPPTTYEVALLTTNPSDDTGTGLVEVSTSTWTNYARQLVTNASGSWNAPAGGTSTPQSVSNAAKIDFGTATISGTAPVVTGVALYDHANPTVLQNWVALTSSQTINNGDPTYFNASALVFQF